MRSLTARLDRWMFATWTASPAQLGVFRIGYSLFTLLAVVPIAPWLGDMPRAFFNPPVGLAALFTGFPSAAVMYLLNGAAVLLLGLLLMGWRTAPVSVATTAVLLVLKSWEYATGKIDHDILLVIAPLVFAGSGWGDALSVDASRARAPAPERQRPCWQLALFAFIIALAMSTSGLLKLAFGWLDPSVQATYRHLVMNNVGLGRSTWLSEILLRVETAWLWKPADWATVLLEVAFLPALLHPRAFRTILALATLFHLGVWLLFDIVFAPNVVAYTVFATGATGLGAWLARHPPFRAWSLPAPAAAVAGGVALATGAVAAAAGQTLAELLHVPLSRMVVAAAAVVGAAYLCRAIAEMWRAPAPLHAPAMEPTARISSPPGG